MDFNEIQQKLLENEDWYHANLQKKEVNEMMKDKTDNSFLVRYSENRKKFAIEVKCEERIKTIMINYDAKFGGFYIIDGKYFKNIVEMIEFYMKHPIKDAKTKIEVTLEIPIETMYEIMDPTDCEENVEDLTPVSDVDPNEWLSRTPVSDIDPKEWPPITPVSDIGHDDRLPKINLNISSRKVEIYENYPKTQQPLSKPDFDNWLPRSPSPEKQKFLLSSNFHPRSPSPITIPMRKDLQNKNSPRKSRSGNLPERSPSPHPRLKMESQLSLPNHPYKDDPKKVSKEDRSLADHWDCKSYDRDRAERVLLSRKDGTFLIRESKSGGFALSVVAKNKVEHFKIVKSKAKNLFGFSEEFAIFESIAEMVNFFRKNSMKKHKETVDIKLKYPFKWVLKYGDESEDSDDSEYFNLHDG